MNITRKTAVAAALLSASALVLSGCAAGSTSETSASNAEKFDIINISGPVSDPFFGSFKQGSDAAAEDLGVDYEYSASKDNTDLVSTYAKLTEAAIAKNPDAIVIGDYFPDALEPLIEKAIAAGIPVFVTNSGRASWRDIGALGFVGENPDAMGAAAGKAAVEAGATNAVCVNQIAGNPVAEQRCKGFSDEIVAGGGKVQDLVIPSEDASNDQKVQQAIAGALNADPGIDMIFTLGSSIATDAIQAKAQAGSDAMIGTTDVSTNVLKSIQSGDLLFSLDQQPYLQGYYGMLMAYQYLKYGVLPANEIDSGPFLITKDNVDGVLEVNTTYPGIRGAS
ncbi:substrate-binding domain-containing protein [Herbiconiux ginsengi]|uniref:Monosaccharide ABC transporter substrate-binding protein, CUT2 family n=1 Tax=Herbiconiux ginsengi TaxID=381665 RepID=A0A1H3MX03_9MICO|nr:substrate-binding domain-containing protein [Herbiconiux ginsengi]SDY81222.1 monosaccharide ABC transporter substrate-binding protein, CUT2 family [Herbiconiux ginsengi]